MSGCASIEEAELMADCKITRVYTGITGSHIRGQNSTGMVIVRDKEVTPVDVARVVETIRREAQRYGVGIRHSELVGLIPQEALVDAAVWYTQLDAFDKEQVLEYRLVDSSASAPQPKPVSFIEELAAPTATPGGGSAGAYAGAMGAGLVSMAAGLTIGKKKYAAVEAQMQRLQDLIVALRRLKIDHGIPQGQRVAVAVTAGDFADEIRATGASVVALARLESLDLVDSLPPPGLYHRILREVEGLRVVGIVTTHGHGDHWQALEEVVAATGARTYAGREDAEGIPTPTDVLVDDGDTITFGRISLTARHLVGHTPGSIALVYDDPHGHPHVFTGDCLFPGGVGNTWEDPARFASLIEGVETKIFGTLPDETWVYPGHGKDTTLGAERPHLAEWRARGW